LLNARDRLGETIIEIVASDVAVHGEEVVTVLRDQNPAAYARLISGFVHFKKLVTERASSSVTCRAIDSEMPQIRIREWECADTVRAEKKASIRPTSVSDNPMFAKIKSWFEANETDGGGALAPSPRREKIWSGAA